MNSEPETQGQEAIITLEGDDGHSYSCQILDIFDFEQKEYALLLNLGDDNSENEDEEQGSLVIMSMTQQGDQSVFKTIESQEEFERVVAHVEEMVKQAEDGDEHEGHDCSQH